MCMFVTSIAETKTRNTSISSGGSSNTTGSHSKIKSVNSKFTYLYLFSNQALK